MKKTYVILAVTLIVLGLGGIGVLFLKEVINSKLENIQIVWSQFYSDDSGRVVSGEILNYDPNRKEKIVLGDIPLDNMSLVGENSFIGFQKTFGDTDQFLGIVIYHSDTGEREEIIDYERLVQESGSAYSPEFAGSIRASSNEKKIYFLFASQMIEYTRDTDTLSTLFHTDSPQFELSDDEDNIYFTENSTLYKYNISHGTKEKIIDGVFQFAVSDDEELIAFENKESKEIWLYYPKNDRTEKIADLHSIDSNLSFGEDESFLLYTDYKYSIVPGNMKIRIRLYDLEEKTTLTAYKGDYSENIRTVLLR